MQHVHGKHAVHAVNHELLCHCMFASLAQVQFYYVNGNANDIVV